MQQRILKNSGELERDGSHDNLTVEGAAVDSRAESINSFNDVEEEKKGEEQNTDTEPKETTDVFGKVLKQF